MEGQKMMKPTYGRPFMRYLYVQRNFCSEIMDQLYTKRFLYSHSSNEVPLSQLGGLQRFYSLRATFLFAVLCRITPAKAEWIVGNPLAPSTWGTNPATAP